MNSSGFKMEIKVRGLHSQISFMKSDINVPLHSFLPLDLIVFSLQLSFFFSFLSQIKLNKYKTQVAVTQVAYSRTVSSKEHNPKPKRSSKIRQVLYLCCSNTKKRTHNSLQHLLKSPVFSPTSSHIPCSSLFLFEQAPRTLFTQPQPSCSSLVPFWSQFL